MASTFSLRLSPLSDLFSDENPPLPISEKLMLFNPLFKKSSLTSSLTSDDGGKSLKSVPNFSLLLPSSGRRKVLVDWKETSEVHVLKMELPGLKKEQVKIDIDDEDYLLTVSGEKVLENKQKGDTWHLAEISSGKFSRTFNLPENAKVEEIKAAMVDGVLTVTVPKVEVPVKNLRSIEISA